MKVLVTGGTGFLGGAVARRLLQRGDQVRSFARRAAPELSEAGVEVVQGDLTDRPAVEAAVQGVDAVVHVAAKAGYWGDLAEYYGPNVAGTANVIGACRRAGVGRLVYTSTPSVVHAGSDVAGVDETAPYATEFSSPYPATKAEAERMVLGAADSSLGTVALRPHLIWGPGDNQLVPRLIERARSGRLRLVGSGDNLIDTTYIDNAAAAHLLALDRLAPGAEISGRAYFIAQGEPMPLRQILDRLLGAAGVGPVDKSVSPAAARVAGSVVEGIWRWGRLRGEPPLTRFLVEQLATDHHFDLSAARRDLGYVPEVSFEDGVERLARFYGS